MENLENSKKYYLSYSYIERFEIISIDIRTKKAICFPIAVNHGTNRLMTRYIFFMDLMKELNR